MADLLQPNRWRVTDANDDPVPGAKALFYDSGTTTPRTVYSDIGGTIPHPSPLVADANGVFAPVFALGGTAVKVVVTTSADVTLYTLDPVVKVPASSSTASAIAFVPTTEVPETDVQAAIEYVRAELPDAGVSDFAKSFLDDADAAAFRATTGAQAADATLTSLSGLSLVAGDILYATGADTLARLPKGAARQTLRMNAGATAPEWAGPVFVTFNGTGTLAILASSGVSSVTDNRTGVYTINFDPALPDANYAVAPSTTANGAGFGAYVASASNGGAPTTKTASALRINVATDSGTLTDSAFVSVIIVR